MSIRPEAERKFLIGICEEKALKDEERQKILVEEILLLLKEGLFKEIKQVYKLGFVEGFDVGKKYKEDLNGKM